MNIETAVNSETKTEQVYRRIKHSILRGESAPGQKLVAHLLAQHFNTSIIPVREALSRLEAENLVTIVPHTGIYVKGIDLERLKELYPIRGILEGYATRLAAAHLSEQHFQSLHALIDRMDAAIADNDAAAMGELNLQFHTVIYNACGNETLIHLIDDLWQKTILARLIFKLTPQRAKASNQEHRKIVEYLENGKPQRAERLIVQQSEKTVALLIRQLAITGSP
jgi:DNA-binding GntR family transcriptional regulator